jgi:hypothetical protein
MTRKTTKPTTRSQLRKLHYQRRTSERTESPRKARFDEDMDDAMIGGGVAANKDKPS